MSRGIRTKYAPSEEPLIPYPPRVQLLKHDYFFPCQRCGLLWPRKQLKREEVTRLLVCPNDYDQPTVQDVQSRRLTEVYFQRFDRLGLNLEQLDY